MGMHSRSTSLRVRAALAAGLMTLGVVGFAGIGHADDDLVEGTPCTVAARACADIDAGEAWLIDDGEIVRGPVSIRTGVEGSETPRGDFDVVWKDKDHHSAEFDGAPMPYAVFFAPGGIAFHEGGLGNGSAGCVRMEMADAEAFYDFLQVGDPVEIR